MSAPVNRLCPDYAAHQENARDRLYPGAGDVLDAEASAAVDAEAEAEYLACEGHG